jgi:hypothetical protein
VIAGSLQRRDTPLKNYTSTALRSAITAQTPAIVRSQFALLLQSCTHHSLHRYLHASSYINSTLPQLTEAPRAAEHLRSSSPPLSILYRVASKLSTSTGGSELRLYDDGTDRVSLIACHSTSNNPSLSARRPYFPQTPAGLLPTTIPRTRALNNTRRQYAQSLFAAARQLGQPGTSFVQRAPSLSAIRLSGRTR